MRILRWRVAAEGERVELAPRRKQRAPWHGSFAHRGLTGTTKLDFSAGNIANLQVVPNSHLRHASRSKWCAKNGVAATSSDVFARCGRVSADVAAKVVDQIARAKDLLLSPRLMVFANLGLIAAGLYVALSSR